MFIVPPATCQALHCTALHDTAAQSKRLMTNFIKSSHCDTGDCDCDCAFSLLRLNLGQDTDPTHTLTHTVTQTKMVNADKAEKSEQLNIS
jgi:hypothetical protein